jgi:hypothetical protein
VKKIRIVFIALAIGLWVPMLFLVRGALQSVSLEREVRHQTLAERVFDEMERRLGEISERETVRSFAEYSFYLAGTGDASRSPLSRPPGQGYVLGYFQIDPDGTFSSPRIPKNPERAIERGDWPAADHPETGVEALERLARAGIHTKQEWVADSIGRGREAAASVQDLVVADAAVEQKAVSIEKGGKLDSYQSAVRSLNRAAERKQKQRRTEYAFAPESVARSGARGARGESGEREFRPGFAAAPSLAPPGPSRSIDRDDSRARIESVAENRNAAKEKDLAMETMSPSPLLKKNKDAPRRGKRAVEVDSIVGRTVNDGTDQNYIVLHRTATLAGSRYRQGLVIDVERLADWLRDDVLRGEALENLAQLELVTSAVARPRRAYPIGYAYRHRFADPFDEVLATLSLPVLADAGGADYLYLISGLLMIVATVAINMPENW